jgi:hypothetical protein
MPDQHGKEVPPEWLGLTPDQMNVCVACGCPIESCKCAEVDAIAQRAAAIRQPMTTEPSAERLKEIRAHYAYLAPEQMPANGDHVRDLFLALDAATKRAKVERAEQYEMLVGLFSHLDDSGEKTCPIVAEYREALGIPERPDAATQAGEGDRHG